MSAPYSLTEQLAKHLQRPVDEATRARARLHLLDWLGCVAGARGWGSQNGVDLGIMGSEESVLLGNVLEMDDVHRGALLHPGPVVWGVAIGMLGPLEYPLSRLLESAVIGYEAMIAVGETFDAHHYAHYHPTATAGVFGSAAVWCHDLDNKPRLAHALAFAGSVAGGVWQTRHSANHGKQWHILNACRIGSSARVAASRGMNAPLDVLEGPQGLYAATCRKPKPMTFPRQWRIHEVSFKPWAACRHAHPVIDCALELRAAGKLNAPFVVET
jgi:2-methylcitrate dehydratase PrpD